ncbi:hypothetical protein LTR85_001442 [Meristemomyces frigidus]|nr:hypothetical protein LTR85_001442 [Meristemomyces frigidus]
MQAPRSAAERSTALPQQLQDSVPPCAQSCLQTYISQEYTSCPSDGVSCLCTRYSSEGYTLGELAFICLQEDCPSASQAEQVSLYDICSAASSAVSATHSTLTLPATATTVSGITTTTLDVYATSLESSTTPALSPQTSIKGTSMSSPPVTVAATSVAVLASSSSIPTTSFSTASASATTAGALATGSSHSTSLTSAQAVGVSIAAFGGMAVLIGLVYIIACIRRRKATKAVEDSKHDSYDFIDEEPPRFSPFHYGYADPRGPLGGFAHPRAELPTEKTGTSEWYREQFPDHRLKSNALSRGPDVDSLHSVGIQRSIDSMRTVSQLLPERPGSMPPRIAPKRPDRSPRPDSMMSPATVFEEDKSPRVPSAQLPPMPLRPLPAHRGLPGKDIRQPQYVAQHNRSPDESRGLALSLEIPKQAARTARLPSPTAFPPPPVPVDDAYASDQRVSRSSKAKSGASTSAGSLLNYYASPEAGSVPDFWEPEPTPISTEPQRRFKPAPAAITVTKPTYPPRAVRLVRSSSAASDTSFESTDPDEPTPPEEEDRRLSAVAEHSPIAAVRYPKVPRSSNQSVPRSPPVKLSPGIARAYGEVVADDRAALPSHRREKRSQQTLHSPVTPERQKMNTSTLSGSTLAAKRRGDSAARDLEGRLYIDTSHSRANSHATVRSPPRNSKDGSEAGSRHAQKTDRYAGSPLKGYGRVASGGGRYGSRTSNGLLTPEMKSSGPTVLRSPIAQEVTLKSPLWEPKLTPSRRGDDLFLQVSLASPASALDGQRRAF